MVILPTIRIAKLRYRYQPLHFSIHQWSCYEVPQSGGTLIGSCSSFFASYLGLIVLAFGSSGPTKINPLPNHYCINIPNTQPKKTCFPFTSSLFATINNQSEEIYTKICYIWYIYQPNYFSFPPSQSKLQNITIMCMNIQKESPWVGF